MDIELSQGFHSFPTCFWFTQEERRHRPGLQHSSHSFTVASLMAFISLCCTSVVPKTARGWAIWVECYQISPSSAQLTSFPASVLLRAGIRCSAQAMLFIPQILIPLCRCPMLGSGPGVGGSGSRIHAPCSRGTCIRSTLNHLGPELEGILEQAHQDLPSHFVDESAPRGKALPRWHICMTV